MNGAMTIQRVYVWQLPVRFYHWVNAACVAGLAATGYIIGKPLIMQIGGEASFSYRFGTVEGRGVISSMAGGWKFIERRARK